MSNHQNEEIEEMKEESIHYDLEQTLREARQESGMSLRSIAEIIGEVLDKDELWVFEKEIQLVMREKHM